MRCYKSQQTIGLNQQPHQPIKHNSSPNPSSFSHSFSNMENVGNENGILFTGICCLDIVSYLDGFPVEDTDSRNVEQVFTLGGNATNSTKVATQLNAHSFLYSAIPYQNPIFQRSLDSKNLKPSYGGHHFGLSTIYHRLPEWALVSLNNEPKNNSLILNRCIFEQFRLNTSFCLQRDEAEEKAKGVPATVVLVNLKNGSRTMFSSLGGKQWPTAAHFKDKFPSLNGFGWFHFEVVDTFGLNEIVEMIKHVNGLRAKGRRPVISIELEQNVEDCWLHQMFPFVDLVFTAKDFAKQLGWQSMRECVQNFQSKFGAPHLTVICPWGEKGVAAKSGNSKRIPSIEGILELAAHPPSSGIVLDTLAAGDCFIAGTVHFLNEGFGLKEALEKATILSGESVGQRGLAALKIPK